MAVEIAEGFDMLGDLLRDARKFVHFVFCRQDNNAIGFPCPCVTVHEANEWMKCWYFAAVLEKRYVWNMLQQSG